MKRKERPYYIKASTRAKYRPTSLPSPRQYLLLYSKEEDTLVKVNKKTLRDAQGIRYTPINVGDKSDKRRIH